MTDDRDSGLQAWAHQEDLLQAQRADDEARLRHEIARLAIDIAAHGHRSVSELERAMLEAAGFIQFSWAA